MADLFSKNLDLTIMRHQYYKTVAQGRIQSLEIRLLEIEEEIEHCNKFIDEQKRVIEEAMKQIHKT